MNYKNIENEKVETANEQAGKDGETSASSEPVIDVSAEVVETSMGKNANAAQTKKPRTTMTVALVFNWITIVLLVLMALTFILCGGSLAHVLAGSVYAGMFASLAGVTGILLLLPLAWCIPMTIRLARVRKACEKPSVALGVCTLLFVDIVSGILILCSRD